MGYIEGDKYKELLAAQLARENIKPKQAALMLARLEECRLKVAEKFKVTPQKDQDSTVENNKNELIQTQEMLGENEQ